MKPQESGGEWVIKTPKLDRHCQVPQCKSGLPAKRFRNGWRCVICIAHSTKKRALP